MKTLIIQGMHCDACQKLITMELDDAGFKDVIKDFRQTDKNSGELVLVDAASEQDTQKVIEIISKMDDYTVNEKL